MASLEDALQQLGQTRVEAKLLAHLLRQGASDTKTLMEYTGLRQPEVSVGIRTLRDDWLEVETVPREGKGRPMHRYALRDKPALVRHVSAGAEARIAQLQGAIATVQQA